MLIVDAVLRTTKAEDEQVVIRAHRLKRNHRINTAGLEEIVVQPYAKHPITGQFSQVTTFSVSRPLPKPEAIRQYELLKRMHPEVRFTIIERSNFFILAEGAYSGLRELPQNFTRGVSRDLSGKSWVKRMLGMPFSTIQAPQSSEQAGLYVGDRLSLQDFLTLKTYSFDTEFMHWEKDRKNRQIVLEDLRNSEDQIRSFLRQAGCVEDVASLQKPALVRLVEQHFNEHVGSRYMKQPLTLQVGQLKENRFVIDYFEHLSGETRREDSTLPSGMPVTLFNHKAADAAGMMHQFRQFLEEHPFLVMISQNGMNYDLKELSAYCARTEGVEPFSIADHEPSVQHGPSHFEKVLVPSIYHIDLAPYSQNYFPFTVDNRFETITSLVLGRRVVKSQGYDDLTRLTIEQIIGCEEAADELREYGIEDVLRLNQVEGYFKTMVYLKSLLFLRTPEDVCVTSLRQLAKEQHEFRAAVKRLTPVQWNDRKRKRYRNLDPAEVFESLLDKPVRRRLKRGIRKGFSRAGLFYLAPFTNMFWKELTRSDRAGPMIEQFKKLKPEPDESSTKNTLMRFDILHTLEEGYILPFILSAEEAGYRDRSGDFRDDNVRQVVARFAELVKEYPPVARSGNFYCFPEERIRTAGFHSAIKHLGYKVAEGRLLTIDDGSFALHDGVSLYVRKADTKARFGFATLYEKELVQDMIRLVFEQGPDAAVRHVARFMDDLRNGMVDRARLIDFKENITRDYLDWSSYSQRFSRIQAYIDLSLGKGDKFAHMRLPHGWVPLEDFLEMPDSEVFSSRNVGYVISRYLGRRDDKGRRTFRGRVGRLLRPLLQHYDMSEQEAVDCVEKGRYEDILKGQQQLFG